MMRYTLSLLLLFTSTQAFAAGAESVLTGKSLLDSDTLTVGDLFTNTGNYADHVLAPAPKPGEKLVLSRNDLQRVVTAFKLNWRDAAASGVTLERNATLLKNDDIVTALAGSDLKSKVSEDAQFKLDNDDDLIVPGREAFTTRINKTDFNPETEAFRAELLIERNGETVKKFPLSGIATAMAKIPALRYAMNSGTTVSANDLSELTLPRKDLRSDTIVSKDGLVGMTLKRGLLPNQMIGQQDIAQPVLVKRNEMITVIYKNGPINLSTKARALANGMQGDIVTLMNMTSKKSFEAKVTGPQVAEVNLDG